jgi:hypothetical protein
MTSAVSFCTGYLTELQGDDSGFRRIEGDKVSLIEPAA